jgi:hypothetical protein
LKKEVETLEAKKSQLVGEVGALGVACTDLENLRKEVESLNRHMEGAKAAETLASVHALKAIKTVLVFINAHRKFCKRTNTVIAFTREYSRVSYLSTGKQWLKRSIIHHHVSTNLIRQLD